MLPRPPVSHSYAITQLGERCAASDQNRRDPDNGPLGRVGAVSGSQKIGNPNKKEETRQPEKKEREPADQSERRAALTTRATRSLHLWPRWFPRTAC